MSALIHPLIGLASRLRGLFTGGPASADLRSSFRDDGDDWVCFSEADLAGRPGPTPAMTLPLPARRPTRVALAA